MHKNYKNKNKKIKNKNKIGLCACECNIIINKKRKWENKENTYATLL